MDPETADLLLQFLDALGAQFLPSPQCPKQIRYEIFFSGYFREIEEFLNRNIPNEILQIIVIYQKMLSIFSIGRPGNICGVNQEKLSTYTQLTHLEELLPETDNIYRNNRSLMIITQNNELYASGSNFSCRFGIKTKGNLNINQFTKIMDNVELVSSGCENNGHCFIYTIDHKLYASGSNYTGHLGNGQKTSNYTDIQILQEIDTRKFLQRDNEYITKIELGPTFSLFLTNYGCVYSCGYRAHGHSGINILSPQLINMNNDKEAIIDIACGYYHSLALDHKQRLIGFGDNEYGQISDKEWNRKDQLPEFHGYFIEKNIKIEWIKAGYCHNLCVDTDGNGYLFGMNNCGQIGDGAPIDDDYGGVRIPFKINGLIHENKIVDGSCGDEHTVLLTNDNQIITFGDNTDNQCSLSGDYRILKPYTLRKVDDIGVVENSFVEKVMAINCVTIIFIDPYKNCT